MSPSRILPKSSQNAILEDQFWWGKKDKEWKGKRVPEDKYIASHPMILIHLNLPWKPKEVS